MAVIIVRKTATDGTWRILWHWGNRTIASALEEWIVEGTEYEILDVQPWQKDVDHVHLAGWIRHYNMLESEQLL